MTDKVLLVDDDQTLLTFVSEFLQKEGFEVHTADRGAVALRIFYDIHPDVVVLDVMMPGMDGWEICARMREMADVPIIMLTAKTAESDKLRGFRLGVDDYVTKPFSQAELAARLQAVLARSRAASDTGLQVHQAGSIMIDMTKREARLNDEALDLTPTEFRLLAVLAQRAGEAVSQDEIINAVWGDHRLRSGSVLRRYIWLLRKKIEQDPKNPQYLITVRGFGYRLER